MPQMPVNNPPTPVMEQLSPALAQDQDCEALKIKFGIDTGSHKANTSGKTKLSSRSYQSHHVLQDAATDALIDRGMALAVMLVDSHSGTEHGEVTKQQNARMNNKGTGGSPQPAKNFGELKKQARDDLVKGLEGRRTGDDGKPMTKKEAEALADCLIAEAEEEVRNSADKKGIDLTDSTPVQAPGGCFPAGCVVWQGPRARVGVSDLEAGRWIRTGEGRLKVARTDRCRSNLVKIELDGWSLELAPFDRVRLEDGGHLRADALVEGDRVDTARGPRRVQRVRLGKVFRQVFSFSFERHADCRIGELGLWVRIRRSGVPVKKVAELVPFRQPRKH